MVNHVKHFVGELEYFNSNKDTYVTLTFMLKKRVTLSCVMLNAKGQVCWEEVFDEKTGVFTLKKKLPLMKTDVYTLWIDINGETILRQLKIENPTRLSLISRFGKLFNK